jgi:chitodextrinase
VSTDGGANFASAATNLPNMGNTAYVKTETMPGIAGELWLSMNDNGLYYSTNSGSSFTKLGNVQKAKLFAIGAPASSGATPAMYVYGKVNETDGVFRSDDRGSTWQKISTDQYAIGQEPNTMCADRRTYGRVYIGTNGNGIYYGEPATDTQAPTAPTGLTASSITSSGVSLSWNAATDNVAVSGYEVYNGTTKVNSTAITGTSYQVTGLAAGTTYTFTVKAVDAAGNVSPASSAVTVTTSAAVGSALAKKAGSALSIDGNLSEEIWHLNNSITKTTAGTPNNTVTFGTLWDNTYLYVAVKVLDASLYNESTNDWDDDAVEIYIDGGNEGATTYDANDRQIVKGYNTSSLWVKSGSSASILHGWAAVTGGYTIEMAIPWSYIGITPADNQVIGFDIANDDDDNGGARDHQAVWMGTADNWKNTSGFGDLTLSGEVVVSAKVNFQPSASPVPSGYMGDSGAAYADRGNGYSYGWDTDNAANTRDRGTSAHADARYRTLNHMQVSANRKWEIGLANGSYSVKVVAGDPSFTNQTNSLNIEGTTLTDPDGQDNFDEYTVTVTVSDGRLTIQPASGASNAKICFVEITSASSAARYSSGQLPDGLTSKTPLLLYPNPAHERIYLETTTGQITALLVWNIQGVQQPVQLQTEANGVSFSVKNLLPGMYMLQYMDEKGSTTTSRFMVK